MREVLETYHRPPADLPNCARRGPENENRAALAHLREHLPGRIAWVESLNAARGEKLRARFAQIDWQEGR